MHATLKRFTEHQKRAEKTFAEHAITQRLDQGLFRSWRCQRPNTWMYGFDVHTTPGSLIVTGDIGLMVFEREADMLAWLRGSINDPYYMAGKVPQSIKTREFCHEVAKEVIRDLGREIKPDSFPSIYINGTGRLAYKDVKERFKEMLGSQSDLDVHDEHSVKSTLYESGFVDGGDFPSLDDFTGTFLWIHSALKWFVANLPADPPESVPPEPYAP